MATKKRTNRTKRNSNSTKTNTRRRSSNKPSAEEYRKIESICFEIALWVLIACALLLFISNFGVGGVVGNAVSGFLFGIFGLGSYIFPIVLIVMCFFGISNRHNMIAMLKLISGIVLFLFLCMLVSLVTSPNEILSPQDAFKHCSEHKIGGGMIGNFLAYYTANAFGKIGAYIINFIILIISVVVISGKSAIKGVKEGGQKVYETARENNERYQEYKRNRDEEKKRRVDNKVTGVSTDTKIPAPEEKLHSDEMDEIINESADFPEVTETYTTQLAPSEETQSTYAPLIPEDEIRKELNIVGDFSKENIQTTDEVPAPKHTREPKLSVEEIEKAVDNVANVILAEEQKQEEIVKEYVYPPLSLLKSGGKKRSGNTEAQLRETAQILEDTLRNFGVNVTVTNISCGPSVTRYELQPEIGVKVSKIVNLADDIKMYLAAEDIRIEAPIPGKAAVGIEVPNHDKVPVAFRDLLETDEFKNAGSKLTFAVGKDIAGRVIVADIAKMPHVLIAGSTGSGKSVCINTIIMSILYKTDPKDVKLILIDPKVVELNVYNGIPHLMIPVVTEPKKAAGALHWAVAEMTERYNKFAEIGVRDLAGYNARVDSIQVPEGQERPKRLPQIVIIVDELADLMMVASNDVEEAICRLAQLARACGIHLVIATQRPSVNVITGLIKANMPSRIAFAVTSGVDSRTILDSNGAEKLLGKGDMLFNPQGIPKPLRIQGAFVSDKEVADVVAFIREQNGAVTYNTDIQNKLETLQNSGNHSVSISGGESGNDGRDVKFVEAAKLVVTNDKASIGMLQRHMSIGFNRAARIMDQLEEAGVVGPDMKTKPREVIMGPEDLERFLEENV